METKVGTHLKPSITPTTGIKYPRLYSTQPQQTQIHKNNNNSEKPIISDNVPRTAPKPWDQQHDPYHPKVARSTTAVSSDRHWNSNNNKINEKKRQIPVVRNPPSRRAARRAARPLGKVEYESGSDTSEEKNSDDSEEDVSYIYSPFNPIYEQEYESKKQELMMNELTKIKDIKEKITQLDIDALEENIQSIETYVQTISKLENQNKSFTIERLNDANTIQALKDQSETLSTENKDLKSKNHALSTELKDLKSKNEHLSSVVAGKSFSSLSDEELDELFQKIMDEKTTRSRCVVCLERQKSLICTPCGHLCLCNSAKCSQGIKNTCPICRSKVMSFTKIYT